MIFSVEADYKCTYELCTKYSLYVKDVDFESGNFQLFTSDNYSHKHITKLYINLPLLITSYI
jgi:hypothetical protein